MPTEGYQQGWCDTALKQLAGEWRSDHWDKPLQLAVPALEARCNGYKQLNLLGHKKSCMKNVRLNLVSAPVSEILITKHIGRIGGYDSASEVYNPVVYLKSPPSKHLDWVTALLSSYSDEAGKIGHGDRRWCCKMPPASIPPITMISSGSRYGEFFFYVLFLWMLKWFLYESLTKKWKSRS